MDDIIDETMQQQVEFGRITDFFSKTRSAYLGLSFNLIMTSFLIAPFAPAWSIALWIVLTIVTYIPRTLLTLRYFKAKNEQRLDPETIGTWERQYFLNSILPFFAFSSVAFLPFTGNPLVGFVIATLAVFVLFAGGVIIYSASLKVTFLYMYIGLGSLLVRCLYEGGYTYYVLALTLVTIVMIMQQLIRKQYLSFIEHLVTQLKFEKASLTDPLTGIANRRHLEIFLKSFIPISRRTGSEFQLVMIDLDKFKDYNDAHGHLKGDEMLVKLAQLVLDKIRSSDFFARYGGEEFALVLTANTRESAHEFMNTLKSEIQDKLGITISAGLSSSNQSDSFEGLLELADQALYQSKQQGRNRVSLAQ